MLVSEKLFLTFALYAACGYYRLFRNYGSHPLNATALLIVGVWIIWT